MSKGAAGTDGEFKAKNFLNVTISKEDFCNKYPKCPIDYNLDRSLCVFCQYRLPLDVKHLLDKANCERNKECQE